MVAGAVTDGDREREERTRCSADREREERIGVGKKARWRRDNDIVWIRRHGGDFFGAGVLFKISSACSHVFQNFCLIAMGYVNRYKK
jgi:hypothetical protein